MKNRCIIIGGGHSVKEGIQKGLWNKIGGERVWSCNFAHLTMPYLPTRELFVDVTFWRNNAGVLQDLHQKGVEIVARRHDRYVHVDGITTYPVAREKDEYYGREAIRKNVVFTGGMGLCGTFALSVAIAEGYEDIYLLGYDFGTPKSTDDFTHYYQGEIDVPSSGVGRPEVYYSGNGIKNFVHDYEVFVGSANIWNVSLQSNIQCFPKLSWGEFFSRLED